MISYEDKMKEKELSLHSFIIAIACLVVQLLSVGSMLSVSVFYIEFMDYFRDSASSTAWINSVCIGTTFLTGPIASTLVNRFGVRSVVIVGALFITTGFILSIFAKTLTMLYFSYGLLTGIGNGFSFGPSIIYVGLSFKK
ncbi:monocarboxylate transporter 3-like isoform X4 [Ptychodera flava]